MDPDDLDLETFFNSMDKKFNFQSFPPGILKQFREFIEATQELEPEIEQQQELFDKYNQFGQKSDQDLDGKLYTEQLDTLLKRISPDLMLTNPKSKAQAPDTPKRKVKLSDEDKILNIIHGTFEEEVFVPTPRKRQIQKGLKLPNSTGSNPFGGAFELPPSSRNIWGKTVISVRKPDGSFETRKMERSSDGTTKTTITKTDADGRSSTESFSGDGKKELQQPVNSTPENHPERHLIVVDGYKIPSLW